MTLVEPTSSMLRDLMYTTAKACSKNICVHCHLPISTVDECSLELTRTGFVFSHKEHNANRDEATAAASMGWCTRC